MCFSTTASFTVGGSLIALGALTLKQTTTPSERPLASIPLLFGIQQCVEGLLWLSLQHDLAGLQGITTYLFTLFSHIIWPAFVPYAVARMEINPEPWRQKAMWGFRVTGIVIAAPLLAIVATQPLTAVAEEHIVYATTSFYDWQMLALYVGATCLAPLFSSHALIRLFGLSVFVFCIIAYWFYTEAFFSVWCFFAAPLSLLVHLHLWRSRQTEALRPAGA